MTVRLGHLRLDVRDLDAVIAFYRDAVGLRVHERTSDGASHYAFLTDGAPVPGAPGGMHHRLVLRQSRDAAGRELGASTRLDHLAFEVPDEAALLAAVERLRARGAEVDLQEAQIAWQCYTRDPEGVRVELYCDRRARPDGDPFWNGRQEALSLDRLRAASEGMG